MLNKVILLLLVSAPLFAYDFDTYYNLKDALSTKNERFRVATKEFNSTHFKTYVEVTLNNPKTSCVILAFGAKSQNDWDGSNVLALKISPNQPEAEATDMIGGSGSNSISRKSTAQDWKFVKTYTVTAKDPSYEYKSGNWKVEILRAYQKTDQGTAYNVITPSASGVTPVAMNLYTGDCPTGAFSYSTTTALLGGFAQSSLKPTQAFGGLMLTSGLMALFAIQMLY